MALNETAATKSMSMTTSANESRLEKDYSAASTELGYEVDVLSQFKANLQQVEDLNLRLRFVLNEVNGLIKRS